MIKTAVIGVGYLGQFHAEKYAQSEKCELTALVDINKERAEEVADSVRNARSCVKPLESYQNLPELGVTCASVVTPTISHFEIVRFLLEHDIDVLVEKPMTVSTEEAKELISVAEQKGRVLQVGHLERFNPAFRAMKSYLTRPVFFEVRRIAPFSGRSSDVDVVLDLMIHDIDIVAHLVGRPLKRVEAIGVPVITQKVDIANARLTFEGGAIANVTSSRAAFKSERTIRIFEPQLYVSLDYGAKKLKIYTRQQTSDAAFSEPQNPLSQIQVIEHPVEERDALEHEIDSFLDCVALRRKPEVGGEDGLRALELAERIRQAFKESFAEMKALGLALEQS